MSVFALLTVQGGILPAGASANHGASPAPQNAPAPQLLLAGAQATLTVRWFVEEGYYISAEPPTTLAFIVPEGIEVSPSHLEIGEEVTSMFEQSAKVTVAKDIAPGTYEIVGAAEYYYCSILEGWCNQGSRRVAIQVKVVEGQQKSLGLLMEIVVPMGADTI